MTFTHRHLETPPGMHVEQLPLDALDDLLDRGDLDDWRPLARALRRDPRGQLAERVLQLCRAHDMYGTSRLWPSFIERQRAGEDRTVSLAELRRRAGKTQVDIAVALGVRQSDVSKLERRGDVRISTLRRYIAALGGELAIVVEFPDAAGVDRLDLESGGKGNERLL